MFIVVSHPETTKDEKAYSSRSSPLPWRNYFTSLLLVAGATLASVIVLRFLTPTNVIMFYLLAVVLASLRLGIRPALLTALLGCWPLISSASPLLQLRGGRHQDLITFAACLPWGR